tara:strand:- start:5002 stop:5154 length:153 start_codon:yes stop_codon:yes gene_type:complete
MENLSYYQKCLEEYQEALGSEHEMLEKNDSMIRLLNLSIESCQDYIKELS